MDINLTEDIIKNENLKKELGQIIHERLITRNKLSGNLRSSFKTLSAKIDLWDKEHILRAPLSGKVLNFKRWKIGEVINQGESFVHIIPKTSSKLIGEATISINKSGKVKAGQKVNVYLENYPYQEYGFVKGTISLINLIPQNEYYSLLIEFPENLKTNMGNQIPIQPNLHAKGEIITENLTLADRVFISLREVRKTNI